jgi:phenylalanyl-tRNA synthetase alpha chain
MKSNAAKHKSSKLIDQLTPSLISSGAWRKRAFRKYDLNASSIQLTHGSKHYINTLKDTIRRIFLSLGFNQVSAPLIDLSFWNFDALFQSQEHINYEAFLIKEPRQGEIPDRKLIDRVKSAHETGWTTGSSGWGYSWDELLASTNILRTQMTAVTIKELVKLRHKQLPLKIFSIDYAFRNEPVDRHHLREFQQVEGLMASENLNFKHLLGFIKNFFNKLGFIDVRFRPGYSTYAEVSVEPEVLDPLSKEWIELGSAGILRPEVVKPLIGFEVPVLVWGFGLERLLMSIYGLSEVKDTYPFSLESLRTVNAKRRIF